MIAVDALRRALAYNPDTGAFTWLPRPDEPRWSGRWAGTVAGSYNTGGYVQIKFEGRLHSAHRLAWAFTHKEWPAGHIDHINGVRDDNRMVNLRLTDRTGNNRNACLRRDSTSGCQGVHWYVRTRRWRAQIGFQHLGYFNTKESAIAARKAAEREQGYHANHGRIPA